MMGKWLEPKDFKCQSQAPDSLRPSSQLSTTPGCKVPGQREEEQEVSQPGISSPPRSQSCLCPGLPGVTAVSLVNGADAPHLYAPTLSSQARKIPGPWTLGHRGDLGAQHGPDQGK